MKAVVYQKPGRSNAAIREVPCPECGDHDVLIRVYASGICKPADGSHDKNGSVIGKYPVIPGHEFAGVVETVGKHVTRFKPGDRVVGDNCVPCGTCYYCQRGEYAFCSHYLSRGQSLNGAAAEFVVIPEADVYHIPDGVSMNAAALTELVGCCYTCIERCEIEYGASVLVLGCGASGMILSQLALNSNAGQVVAIDTVESKLQRIATKGVETVLVDPSDFSKHTRVLLERYPLGFDVIIDAVGNAKLNEISIPLLKSGGTFAGYSFPSTEQRTVGLDMGMFIIKSLRYIGSTFQTKKFSRCLEFMRQGKVDGDLLITDEYSMDEYFMALDKNMNDPDSVKAVIHPN